MVCRPFEARAELSPSVIYGEDNRQEISSEANPIVRELSRSVAALIDDSLLYFDSQQNLYSIALSSYKDAYALCESERFIEQKIAADCTGFLVTPELLATAGHCVSGVDACRRTKILFDFALNPEGASPAHASPSQVYSCSEVIVSRSSDEGGNDFALIRLDRPVSDRFSLSLASTPAELNTEIFVIGHPSGLPMKISDGARIRSLSSNVFSSNLDTYAGSSGSPVFNSDTFQVQGILVSGERDFESLGLCNVSYRCASEDCRGEVATESSLLTPYLKDNASQDPSQNPSRQPDRPVLQDEFTSVEQSPIQNR